VVFPAPFLPSRVRMPDEDILNDTLSSALFSLPL